MSQLPLLDPLPHPLGVLQPYYAPSCTSLVLKPKLLSWSGDDFHIKTVDGAPVFRAHGAVMSLSGRTDLRTAGGESLLTVRRNIFSIPSSFYAEDPQGSKFMSVEGKFSFGSNKSTINFVNAHDGQQVKLKTKGNFLDTRTEIFWGDKVVAVITKNVLSYKSLVTVAQGMDMALAVAVGICNDERKNRKNGAA